jgi:hypothetical protein
MAGIMCVDSVFLLTVRVAGAVGFEALAGIETAIPRFFQVAVLLHTAIGLILTGIAFVFFVLHLRIVLRRRGPASVVSGSLLVAGATTVVITGLFILTDAASRDNRWVWWLHVCGAGLVVGAYVRHRFSSIARLAVDDLVRFSGVVVAAGALLVAAQAAAVRSVRLTPEAFSAMERGHDSGPGSKDRTEVTADGGDFAPLGFVQPGSPFFPSPATTTSGWYLPSRIVTRWEAPPGVAEEATQLGFSVTNPIGASTCGRCHQDVVKQWESSAHRFASMNNPFYEAAVNLLRDSSTVGNQYVEDHVRRFPEVAGRVGSVKSKWCGGCHDPSIMLAGEMDQEFDRVTVEAQAGLTCLACHLINEVHDRTGNGNYNIADDLEDQYLFPNSADGTVGAFLHDAALKAKPTAHRARMIQPFFRESEYCATCHKVSLSPAINNYRWLRGQNEFDAWEDSGVSLNASRTFYLPPAKLVCQDCHMPLEPAPLGDVAAKNGLVRFVCNYVRWTPETDLYTTLDGTTKSYATPQQYEGESCWLYRNRDGRRFDDVTRQSGVYKPDGKSLGVAVADFNDDGWPDIVVANDTEHNFLYLNQSDGTFTEVGVGSGIGYDEYGRARAGMGIDVAEVGDDGNQTIVIGNFAQEPLSFYTELEDGLFQDVAGQARLTGVSLLKLTFGVIFVDLDLDGRLDLVTANGHIEPTINEVQQNIGFAQEPQVFLNAGDGSFVDAGESVGGGFAKPVVGRGIAFGDIDRDGDPDLLITVNGGRPMLLRNDLPTESANAIALELRGTAPNTGALGAVVTVFTGSRQQRRMVRTGSSYLSQSDFGSLLFGLGQEESVDSITVRWPISWDLSKFEGVPSGHRYSVVEGADRLRPLGQLN